MSLKDLILRASDLGVELSESQAQKLIRFLELLYDENTRINLTRVPQHQALELHILDSLSLAQIAVPKVGSSICDVGTGGGLPGIPLAITYPESKFTLLESIGKKIRFVARAVEELGLENVTCLQSRAEDHIGKHDLVLARAVAPLKKLLPMVATVVKPKGTIVAYKGPGVEEELKDLPRGFQIKQSERFRIGDSERVLVMVGRV
jgi:16S rRNA (guanine527-N7)-methyltransferase